MTLTFKEIYEDLRNTTQEKVLLKLCTFTLLTILFSVIIGAGSQRIEFAMLISLFCITATYLIDKDLNRA